MTGWDEQALAWLSGKVEELQSLEVVAFYRHHVQKSWRRNVDRYEPSHAGDTSRSLGINQSENLRELMVRDYRDNQPRWKERGVDVSAPHQSLLVVAAGLFLHAMKAPVNRQQEPGWSTWRWSEADSNVRLQAARDNRARYTPEMPELQQCLPGLGEELNRDPDRLRHAMVIYCGDDVTARTSGWLAVPSADDEGLEGHHPWMAVAPLWWDERGADGRDVRPGKPDPLGPQPFDARPAPTPSVSIKPDRRKPSQQ